LLAFEGEEAWGVLVGEEKLDGLPDLQRSTRRLVVALMERIKG
jgi:hypothetical protein